MTIIDSAEREAAIDPTGSYCVSAPAGSGKTELLIQRYLCLLSRVSRPEQVLAITFTRKAAAEMRERVLEALQSARDEVPCSSPHEEITRRLAEQALTADSGQGWHLVRDISRLNIKTIDSFCAGLTRQMPVLSQLGGQAGTQDDATELYAEAVVELFKHVDGKHPVADDLTAMMLHFDNNWERLQELLVSMLGRRDQWRGYVGVHRAPEESEAYLVSAIASLVQDALDELSRLLAPYAAQIHDLQCFAAGNLSRPQPADFPGTENGKLAGWRGVRDLLLTGSGGWRKRLTKNEGFPAGKGEPGLRKEELKSVIAELQQIEGLEEKLQAIVFLPEIEPGERSWQLVLHLSRLLPMLAAELLLVFQRHGVVDHSQVAQSALVALGEDDAPTDLAMRLDYRIEHILVDEFQDTAVNQYDLLQKLTRGWGEFNASQPEAPRTLLIVGDGMQSIYGFRGANVGLFLKARLEGFNGVELQHLELRSNFRSDQGVVDWVNQTFARAFPQNSDANRSRVSYSAATAVRPLALQHAVALQAFVGDDARENEVAFICQHIGAALVSEPGHQIAVLARTRGHLQPVIAGLKALSIPYHAQDLDSLAHSPVVADLLTLCRVMANDADRLAWMALLRAPWCGLTLADLLTISDYEEEPRYTSLWEFLGSSTLQQALSEEGQHRLKHILPSLWEARKKRERLGLRVWIEQAWVGMGGPACASDSGSLRDAESFLQLLEHAEAQGIGLDIAWLSRRLEKLYMNGGDPDSAVHLMTMHKAKGLEFDCVIIPQLGRQARGDDRELLLWDEHSNTQGDRSFLLAADDRSPKDAPTLYNYLRQQRQQKALLESTRLLYVGATRAVRHLLLTASLTIDEKSGTARAPSRHSLLGSIWPTFESQMTLHESLESDNSSAVAQPAPSLTRLRRASPARPLPGEGLLSQNDGSQAERRDNHFERITGTVVHLALEELSSREALPAEPSDRDLRRWRLALQREGLFGNTLEAALSRVLDSVARTLDESGAGRWVLSSGHDEAHSEWALTRANSEGGVEDIVIDRSFIDQTTGIRWLVDYKNSQPDPGESIEVFTAREAATYRSQLIRYRDTLRQMGDQPLHCALFFTALGKLYPVDELQLPAKEQ